MKKVLIALGGSALLIAATLGASYAQTAPTAQQQARQSVIQAAAAKLGINATDLEQALKDARKDLGQTRRVLIGNVVKDELTVAAKAIGLADARALRTELRGSTLTAVAQKHNVPAANVAAAIKADVNARIDAAVSAGKLKADRAATMKQKVSDRVDALMTREFKAKA